MTEPGRRICVFCSSREVAESYLQAAVDLVAVMAGRGDTLVYGGTPLGMMGVLAREARRRGVPVVGVTPQRFVDRGYHDEDADELVVTPGMAGRKEAMLERSDAFVVLPGGFGTLDELIEMVTLRQLGYHDKPVVLVDTDEFWQPLLRLLDGMIEAGFARSRYRELYAVAPTPARARRILESSRGAGVPEKAEVPGKKV